MNKSRKTKRKSLKKRRIKGSGNCASRSRIEPEPARGENSMYFTVKWIPGVDYRIYDEYHPNDNYLILNVGSSVDWLAYQEGLRDFDDVISVPTNNMLALIDLQIRDLTNNIDFEVRNRVIAEIRHRTMEELELKRERYKYMAIRHYVYRMLNADVEARPPVHLPYGRRVSTGTVFPQAVAEEIKQTAAEYPDSLYPLGLGGRRKKSLKKKRKRARKSIRGRK